MSFSTLARSCLTLWQGLTAALNHTRPLLAMLAAFGSGAWSADGWLLKPWLRRRGWLKPL